MMSKKKDNGVPGLCRTRWSRSINPADTWKEYPRPAMVRASYINLNGMWDYCFTPSPNIPARFEGQLPVPFSPEAPLSGVGRRLSPDEFLWYRRSFTLRKQQKDQRVLLHFGAVDQECAVFVNGKPAGEHTGGYLPFTLDITDIAEEASNELLVRVRDYSDTSCYSRGKQKLDKGGMFYTAQSGIWQTVWLELVPDPYISAVHFTPDYDDSCCRVRITAGGRRKGGPYRIVEFLHQRIKSGLLRAVIIMPCRNRNRVIRIQLSIRLPTPSQQGHPCRRQTKHCRQHPLFSTGMPQACL